MEGRTKTNLRLSIAVQSVTSQLSSKARGLQPKRSEYARSTREFETRRSEQRERKWETDLVPSERQLQTRISRRVDEHHSSVEFPDHTMSGSDVLGEDGGGEPILGIVGFGEDFFDG